MSSFTTQQVTNLQRGARGALVFGIVTSVAANVTNTFVRPSAATTATWLLIGASVLHALAPVVLFVCTEMVSRIPKHNPVLFWVRIGVTLAVGGFAAWISYWNMEELAGIFDPGSNSRYFYPLIIDGMMIVATISLIELGGLARTVETIAKAEQAQAVAAVRATAPKVWVVDAAEEKARAKAGYGSKTTAEKTKWSMEYRRDRLAEEAKAEIRAAKKAAQQPTTVAEQPTGTAEQFAASGASV